MKLSILITTFKRANLLKWNLLALSQQNLSTSFEVLVLNDGQPDDTEALCNSYKNKLNIKYIFTGQRNLENIKWRIPGFAFNIGAKIAQGEIIILSCAEMFIVNDKLQTMINPILNNKKLLTIPNGKSDTKAILLNHINKYNTIKDNSIYETLPDLRTKMPFFMGINKQEFINIGGYDETFTGWAWDDDDLIYRLRRNNCSYNQTDLKIVHLFHKRSKRFETENWNFNKTLFQKNKDKKIIVVNKEIEWGKFNVET